MFDGNDVYLGLCGVVRSKFLRAESIFIEASFFVGFTLIGEVGNRLLAGGSFVVEGELGVSAEGEDAYWFSLFGIFFVEPSL